MVILPFQDGKLYGYRNLMGEVVVPPKYAFASESHEGFAVASADNETRSLVILNSAGAEVFCSDQITPSGSDFSHGLLAAQPGPDDASVSKLPIGYLTPQGEWAIEPRFSNAFAFDQYGACVQLKRGGRWSRIDREGNLLGQHYKHIWAFHPEGNYTGANLGAMEAVQTNVLSPDWKPVPSIDLGWVVVDRYGEIAYERKFNQVELERGGLIPVTYEYGLVGWINTDFKTVFETHADGIGHFFESDRIVVEKPYGKYGLMNPQGEWVVPPEFDRIHPVGPNRFAMGHTVGLYPEDNEPIIEVRLADKDGHFLSEDSFSHIYEYNEGVAWVQREKPNPTWYGDALMNFIDLDGNLLLPEWSG